VFSRVLDDRKIAKSHESRVVYIIVITLQMWFSGYFWMIWHRSLTKLFRRTRWELDHEWRVSRPKYFEGGGRVVCQNSYPWRDWEHDEARCSCDQKRLQNTCTNLKYYRYTSLIGWFVKHRLKTGKVVRVVRVETTGCKNQWKYTKMLHIFVLHRPMSGNSYRCIPLQQKGRKV
jgi:hypothetical protein